MISSQPTLQADGLQEVHVFWLAGMSCDGCSISTVGATSPSAESLMLGIIPGVPKIVLHHPVLSTEAGEDFMEPFHKAARGQLDKQFVVVYEGSVANERLNDKNGGYFSALGTRKVDGEDQPFPTADMLGLMAPHAAAVIAIGTCATWGGNSCCCWKCNWIYGPNGFSRRELQKYTGFAGRKYSRMCSAGR